MAGAVEENSRAVEGRDEEQDIPEEEMLLLELGLQVSEDEYDFFNDIEDLESDMLALLDELEEERLFSDIINTSLGDKRKKSELKNYERKQIAVTLLHKADDNSKLPRGIMSNLAQQFSVCRQTIGRLWKTIIPQLQESRKINIKNGKKGSVGRKPKTIDIEQIKGIPKCKRTNLRTFASALGVSPSFIHRILKRGVLRRHSNAIKPTLKEHNKLQRIQWALSMIIPRNVNQPPRFRDMYSFIHVDEKWFFMSKLTERYYLLPCEEDPERHCQSKRFIPKVMFLSAVARPWQDFDGKIGIFPFVEDVAAIRSSKNREAGTIEVKAIQSITREVIGEAFVSDLIPAIKSKWPENACKTIWLQQDNVRPHIDSTYPNFVQAATSDGFSIHLINQPANSPDLNTLDLGYFNGVQSIQHQKCPRNIDELVKAVKEAYEEYEPRKLNHTWLHLQMVMTELLKVNGGNNYKNPHKGKNKLENQGLLPTSFTVEDEVIAQAEAYLEDGLIDQPIGRGRNTATTIFNWDEIEAGATASTSSLQNSA